MLLETHRHLEDLLRAAQGKALPQHHDNDQEEEEEEEDEGVYLCLDCIER